MFALCCDNSSGVQINYSSLVANHLVEGSHLIRLTGWLSGTAADLLSTVSCEAEPGRVFQWGPVLHVM